MGKNQFSVYGEKPVFSVWRVTSFQCMERNQLYNVVMSEFPQKGNLKNFVKMVFSNI
jgi:hypothetical protein